MGLTQARVQSPTEIIDKLREHCNAGRNRHTWRLQFASMKQRENQSVDKWLNEVRIIAHKCEFASDCCSRCEPIRILEKFISISNLYDPLTDGRLDGIFVSKSLDSSTHFESVCEDVKNIYNRIFEKDLKVSARPTAEEEQAIRTKQTVDASGQVSTEGVSVASSVSASVSSVPFNGVQEV